MPGAVYAAAEYAKEYPTDAAKMGMIIAKSAGIKQEYGVAFASGFLGTANLKWAAVDDTSLVWFTLKPLKRLLVFLPK